MWDYLKTVEDICNARRRDCVKLSFENYVFWNIIESESEKWFILPFLYLISVVIKITDYWWIYYVNA